MEEYSSSFNYTNSTWDYDNSTWGYDNSTWDYDNSTWGYDNSTWDYDNSTGVHPLFLVSCIVVSSGVPLSAVAVYVLYSLVRHDHAPAPVYIINLLISDIIQICSLIVNITPFDDDPYLLFSRIHNLCVLTSVVFMVCLAFERYLLIAWPLWYRFRRSTRISVVVSVLVWIFCIVVFIVIDLRINFYHSLTIFGILFLLPFPLFIFCLGGSLRALSASCITADEKRRIVAVLVLVLLIYTLFFLPTIINLLSARTAIPYELPFILIRLNPLADLVLYIFMRKSTVDKLLASVCCCKSNGNDSNISST